MQTTKADAAHHDSPAAYTYLVESFCRLLDDRGFDRSQLLEGTGLSAEQVADPAHRIGERLLRRLLRRTVEIVADPSIGLDLGLILSVRAYGFWGYAAIASTTLREATFGVLEPYHSAFSPFDISVRFEDSTCVIQSDERSPWNDLLPVLVDAGIVSFSRILEGLVGGPLSKMEVRVPFGEQPHHRILRSMVRASVRFDCTAIQFRFPTAELDRPILSADSTLARLARAQCEEELARVRKEASTLALVRRQVIATVADGSPLQRVAGELHMTPRTLRRRLEALGTSYQDLVDQTRRGLATEYLIASDRPVNEIASLLGYRDDANFRRAFRRWTGTSPATYREAHRSDQVERAWLVADDLNIVRR